MSGPVWRVVEGDELRCDECLATTGRVLTEGRVVDGEYLPDRRLCPTCYDRHIALLAKRT